MYISLTRKTTGKNEQIQSGRGNDHWHGVERNAKHFAGRGNKIRNIVLVFKKNVYCIKSI